ncbi:hypothetical protein [Prosthecomicrobium sp. N25]|uniref:hypothetical protein n=1 Tax=Prosthecomicrobium sp. N25 TaxID=3129254 RepID=UPI00307827C0
MAAEAALAGGDLCHVAAARVAVPAGFAFAFLADPLRLGRWSLGCMETGPTDRPGLYTGRSLFDGGQGFFSVEAHPELGLVDWRVGPADRLVRRINARVVPGADAGLADGECLVILTAWRVEGMPTARWERLKAAHEAEIWLIKEQAEAAWEGR